MAPRGADNAEGNKTETRRDATEQTHEMAVQGTAPQNRQKSEGAPVARGSGVKDTEKKEKTRREEKEHLNPVLEDHKYRAPVLDRDSLEGQTEILRNLMVRKMGTDKVLLRNGRVDWSKIHHDVKTELHSLNKVASKLDHVNLKTAPENSEISWEEITGLPRKA